VTNVSRPSSHHHHQQQQQQYVKSEAGESHDRKSSLVEPPAEVTASPAGCELVVKVGSSIASSNSNDEDDDDVYFDAERVNASSAELDGEGSVWNERDENIGDVSRNSPLHARPTAEDIYNSTDALSNTAAAAAAAADDDVKSSKTTMTSNVDTLPRNVPRLKTEAAASVSQGFGTQPASQQFSPSAVRQLYNVGLRTDDGRFPVFSNSSASAPSTPKTPKKSPGERQSSSVDYRRSERGLSFLFPSFSDHGMSLLDKVRITVARHKNNYFLGWTDDQLARLDPIVRPKVPVTPAVYREYCHRNAMKYDSNLQFACESPEPWAAEFRARLTLPPADGGFSSLCEVKLEAGRLWREHSGRYRMHNIVKWQMGMNSAVLANGTSAPATSAAVAPVKPDKTRGKNSPSINVVEHQLTCPGLDRHQPSTSAVAVSSDNVRQRAVFLPGVLSVTAPPVSVALSSSALFVSPVCSVTPMFAAGQLSLASTAATETSRNSSSSSDVLDMSVTSASASTDDSGLLFEPLPDDMPAASQLQVWLERHRRGYFVDAPSPSSSVVGDPIVDYVRPRRWPVTAALLDAQIPAGVVEVLRKIDRLLSLPVDRLPTPVRRFRERLHAVPGSDDSFATFEEAVTEALSACRTAEVEGLSANGGVVVGTSRHRKRKRSRPEHAMSCTYNEASASDGVQMSSNGTERPIDCISSDDDDDDDDGSLVVALPPSGNTSPTSVQSESPSSVASLSVDAVQQMLWTSRTALHDACVTDPALSWDERLVPVRATLRSCIGRDYVTPAQSHAAAVDLVLAVLHTRLDDLARSFSLQTRQNQHADIK